MILSNRSAGTSFENAFARALHGYGFWVHPLRQSESGQPADIIACRDGRAWLIDCKACARGRFDLSRVEENQTLAMTEFEKRGGSAWFAVMIRGAIWMLSFRTVSELRAAGWRSLGAEAFGDLYGVSVDEWARGEAR